MIFQQTKLEGAFLIQLEIIEDKRGFFARSFCEDEFKSHDIDFQIKQCNISYNHKRGTLRGLHYQTEPFEEKKLISCISGEIYDVFLDIRRDSPTFGQWEAIHLGADCYNMLYLPKGFAHGFQALRDNTSVKYAMGEYYVEKYAAGIRWNDPGFNIKWPIEEMIISDKDRQYEDYKA